MSSKQVSIFVLAIWMVSGLSGCGGGSSTRAPASTGTVVTDPGLGDNTDGSDPAGTAPGDATAPSSGTVTGTTPSTPTGSASGLTVVLQGTKSVTTAQLDKLKQAVTAVNQVINTPQFKDQVLNFTYNGIKQFVQSNGMTNQQVYDFLIAGAEKYPTQQTANHTADLYIATYFPPWYRSYTSAVAFTNTSDQYEYLYNSYFTGATVPEIANTIIHEWTHRMGFSHDFNSTSQRPYSVPYGIGKLVETAVKTYLGK